MKIRNQIYGIFGKKSSQGKMVHFELPDRIHTLTKMDEASLIVDGIIRQFPLIYEKQNQTQDLEKHDLGFLIHQMDRKPFFGNENILILRRCSL